MNGVRSTPARGEIRFVALSKTYTGIGQRASVVALHNFTIEIAPGQFVAIVGPSGCGKTTLLNIVAGFERQTSGHVVVDGKPVERPGADRGVVFQDYALFPWLNVLDNVSYGLLERGRSRPVAHSMAREWLQQVGLQQVAEAFPHELSGGMKQRVALVRVLANESHILLMDEPFASVDALTRIVLQRELLVLWEKSLSTILFVTHSVDEAIFLADRVVIMSGQPGTVAATTRIDLPRPRSATSAAFNRYRRWAFERLQAFERPQPAVAVGSPN